MRSTVYNKRPMSQRRKRRLARRVAVNMTKLHRQQAFAGGRVTTCTCWAASIDLPCSTGDGVPA